MKPLAPKTTLQNRYQITELIGKGGMGEVYLAIDQRLGHSVALKRTTVGDDIMLNEAFEREARTLASLRHNVLPKVSDHFVENDEQFLVMEYISGEDLSERLKSTNKPFPMNWVLFWADQLLEALTYLHNNNPPIIHRDIKPQNLKLTAENHIVLLDFGLSKNVLGQTRVTTSGSVVGYTPHYAPMEQIRGTGTNARSDIFSLSATLYHLLSNSVPPDSLTRADSMLAGMPDPLRPLTELNPEVTQSISDAIMKGLEISQDKRYVDAREMQKALRRAYNDMQKSMSADTIAFSAGSAGLSQSDLKTEVIPNFQPAVEETSSTPDVSAEDVGQNTLGTPAPFPPNVDYSAEKTEAFDISEIQDAAASPNLEATVQFGGDADDSGTDDLTGLRTEVIPDEVIRNQTEAADNYAAPSDVPAEVPVDADFQTDDDVSSVDFKTSEDLAGENDFSPDATVPLITMEDAGVTAGQFEEPSNTTDWNESFESEAAADQTHTEAAAFGLTDNFAADRTENFAAGETGEDDFSQTAADVEEVSAAGAVETAVPVETVPPPVRQKSSAGKYIAILGGLGVILFLLLGTAGAVGWYYTNGGFNFGGGNTATEEKTPEAAPSEEANPEVVDTTETNPEEPAGTDGGNTETADTTQADPGNTDVDSTDTTASTTDRTDGGGTSSTAKTTTPNTKKTNTRTTTSKPPVKDTTAKKPPVRDSTSKPPPTPVKKKKKDAGVL
jgi:serine/threonine protein kinase